MSEIAFYRNRLQNTNNISIRFLNTLNENLTYQKHLLKYWDQIPKNPQGLGPTQDILDIIYAILKTLFVLPDDCLKLLSRQYLESNTEVDPQLPEYLTYEIFTEAISQLIFNLLEKPDLTSCIQILDILHCRIYRRILVDVSSNVTMPVPYKLSVVLFTQDQIEYLLKQDTKKSMFNMYYQEEYIYDQELLDSANKIPSRYIKYQLAKEILPLGFSAECVIQLLINNNCQALDEYYHHHSDQFNYAKDVKLTAQVSETFLLSLPNSQMVPEACLQYILQTTEQTYGYHEQFYKLSSIVQRNLQWSQFPLQNLNGIKLLINVKSEFFTEEDYRIDQICKVNKKWERKLLSAKRQLLTSQLSAFDISKSSNPDKVVQKNIAAIQRKILGDLQSYQKDTDYLLGAIDNIKNQQEKTTTPNFNQYLSKFISTQNQLPSDTFNTHLDLIEYANQAPPQILLVGKPRSGRSTFLKALCKQQDLEYIDLERGITKIFNKVQENENNPAVDEEGNPKEFLTELERSVYDALRQGKEVTQTQLESLLNLELLSDPPSNKGYALDLPIEDSFWVNSILSNKMKLPKIRCRYFTHVIQLNQTDEDILHFASKIMEKQEDLIASSQFDREEQKRPKVIYKDPNDPDEEEEQPPDDEEKPPIVEEKDQFFRPLDQEFLQEQLSNFANQQEKLNSLYSHLPEQNIISLESAGLTVDQLVQRISLQIGKILRPLAIKLEGGSEKDLLGLNLTDEKVFRIWSQWQQIDPVELYIKEKVINGKVEFACEYAGRIFLFDNEENQNKFLAYPRKYLQKQPELPKSYIVSVHGPRMSGKNTVAQQLSQFYGWTLVDVEEIVKQKVLAQMERQKHLVSTFDPRVNDIHLTEIEFKEFQKGNPIKDVLQMVLNHLGFPLQRKPPGWGEPKKEEEEQPQEEEEEKKKKESKKPLKKKKEEVVEVVDENVKPVTPPPEDIPTKEIIPQLDQELKVSQQAIPKGIILIGYPQTQEQIDQLNLWGIKIDKFIFLQDRSEEPGQILLQRNQDLNIETELAQQGTLSTLIKEAYQEDNVKEISIEGSKEQVWSRVRLALDPFYIRADDEGFVRIPTDVQEGEEPIVFGDYAHYCPVTLKNSNWLIPGKEDFIAMVRGQVYRFYGEKEQQQFKDNVQLYVPSEIKAPPPRIMVIGVRGCGLRTQLKILNRLYKLPVLDLKINLLDNLQISKENRQLNRYLSKGFKPKELDADGKEIPDPEIMDDPGDFDRKVHEIEQLNKILENENGLIIQGNFFDVNEEYVSTPLVDLLVEAKKLPEIVILLKVEADNFIKRNFDTKIIEDEYQTKINELKLKRFQEKVEARNKAIEEQAEEIPEIPMDAQSIILEEEDPEAPKLEDMIKEQKEKLLQQHEADSSKIEELKTQFEELKIRTELISTDTSIEMVTERIVTQLSEIIDQTNRQNLFEKHQCFKLQPYFDLENFKLNKLDIYEKLYTHKPSKFGDRNPITLQNLPHCRDYPLLYRNRIYYLDNEEQRNQVAQKPFQYLYNQTVPTDIQIKPCVFIIGKVKSGKTEIVKLLSEKLNLVRVKLSHLLSDFISNQTDLLSQKIKEQLRLGQEVEMNLLIELIQKRIQLVDCYTQGFILDGYPRTIEEAMSLSKVGIIPTIVFICDKDDESVLRKVNPKFGGIDNVIHSRLNSNQTSLVAYYYEHKFNNIRYLRVGQVSNWGMISLCTKTIQQCLLARAQIARSIITAEPVRVSLLTLTKQQILQKLSSLYNYCPVLIKAKKNYFASSLRSAYMLFYDDALYFVSSEDTEQDFIKNPTHYCNNELSKYKVPKIIQVGDKQEQYPEFKGFCPVELINNKLVKGLTHLIIQHKNQQLHFSSAYNMQLFEMNPQRYKHARLPDKLPLGQLATQKNIAKKVAKRGDCTSYLELHLKNIIIRVLAQLGYQKPKYPTLTCKETVLKFIAISLKANNKNKDAFYRQKYQEKLEKFIQNCTFSQEILELYDKSTRSDIDQETLLKKVEQFDIFMTELQNTEKLKYFQQFIR